MKRSIIFGLLAFALIEGLFAQSTRTLEGSWRGDKALGDVIIGEDGNGSIIFEANPELTMAIRVTFDGTKYTITQAEPNHPDFYLAFNKYLRDPLDAREAEKLAGQARAMHWVFTLSADEKRLVGRKFTTAFKRENSELAIDNSYSRDAAWTRLEGRVSAPLSDVPSGTVRSGTHVALSSVTPGARILYTTDGSIPGAGSAIVYTQPITVDTSMVLNAVAIKDGWLQSAPSILSFFVQQNLPTYVLTKDSWKLSLLSVQDNDEGTLVSFALENLLGEPRTFYLSRANTRLITDTGDECEATKVILGNEEDAYNVSSRFFAGAPLKGAILFPKLPAEGTAIAALDINRGSFIFQDLSIGYAADISQTPSGDYKSQLTIDRVSMRILSAIRTDEGLLISMTITSDREREFYLNVGSARFVDTHGYEDTGLRASLGSSTDGYNATANLLPGIPLKASMLLKAPKAGEDRLEVLEFNRGSFVFRDVPMR